MNCHYNKTSPYFLSLQYWHLNFEIILHHRTSPMKLNWYFEIFLYFEYYMMAIPLCVTPYPVAFPQQKNRDTFFLRSLRGTTTNKRNNKQSKGDGPRFLAISKPLPCTPKGQDTSNNDPNTNTTGDRRFTSAVFCDEDNAIPLHQPRFEVTTIDSHAVDRLLTCSNSSTFTSVTRTTDSGEEEDLMTFTGAEFEGKDHSEGFKLKEVTTNSQIWLCNSTLFASSATNQQGNCHPVWRKFYNPSADDHHGSALLNEYHKLIIIYWRDEEDMARPIYPLGISGHYKLVTDGHALSSSQFLNPTNWKKYWLWQQRDC